MKSPLKRAVMACAILCASMFSAPAMAQDISVATVTPVVSTSPSYSAGDVVGGLITFQDASRVNGAGGLLQSVRVNFASSQLALAMDFVWCGPSNLPNTTLTDNAAVSVAPADFAACRVVHVTDCVSLGTPTACVADQLAIPYTLNNKTVGYGFLVTRGSLTMTSPSDVAVTLGLLRN